MMTRTTLVRFPSQRGLWFATGWWFSGCVRPGKHHLYRRPGYIFISDMTVAINQLQRHQAQFSMRGSRWRDPRFHSVTTPASAMF